MKSYRVTLEPQTKKVLAQLRRRNNVLYRWITQAIDSLSNNPRPRGCKKLKGVSPPVYRIRVGSYRIVYEIREREVRVNIVKVDHRKDAYR